MREGTKISEAEWAVMNLFWEDAPRTANEVVDILVEKTDWQDKTIRTLINRLVKKGALGFERNGREYSYFPNVTEDECVKQEVSSVVAKFRSGALKPLLAAFFENEALSEEDVLELKKILDKRGEKR